MKIIHRQNKEALSFIGHYWRNHCIITKYLEPYAFDLRLPFKCEIQKLIFQKNVQYFYSITLQWFSFQRMHLWSPYGELWFVTTLQFFLHFLQGFLSLILFSNGISQSLKMDSKPLSTRSVRESEKYFFLLDVIWAVL